MTGAEILILLKDASGYGLAALFAWLWFQERGRNNTLQDSRMTDMKDLVVKSIETDRDQVHAMNALTEVIKSRP